MVLEEEMVIINCHKRLTYLDLGSMNLEKRARAGLEIDFKTI